MTLHFLPQSDKRVRFGARQLPRLFRLAALLLSPAIAAAQAAPVEPPKPREPEVVALKTNDGVKLTATYYPSKAGKKAAAVILLHAHAGKRSDLDGLALRLQLTGCAVIAPDLRGHGDSTGDFGELKPQDYADMYERDLEAVKGFLMQQNNAGELNIERLGVVGMEMGSMVAINWAALDWSWPELANGKQGEDVKALVLISPEWSYKGVRISDAVVDPSVRSELAILIVSGNRNSRLVGEARRLYKALAKYHDISPSLPVEQQTLILKTPTTSMQGTPLLNDKSMHVEDMILEFVDLQLQKPTLAWQMRKSPL
jgi:pimeloyl-ACP methyl ester carboxylesterase